MSNQTTRESTPERMPQLGHQRHSEPLAPIKMIIELENANKSRKKDMENYDFTFNKDFYQE